MNIVVSHESESISFKHSGLHVFTSIFEFFIKFFVFSFVDKEHNGRLKERTVCGPESKQYGIRSPFLKIKFSRHIFQ